jgi:hypothetical protein
MPIKIGDTYQKIASAYQTSQQIEPSTFGHPFLHLQKFGIWFFFDKNNAIDEIRFDRPFAGRVMGVAIGDTISFVEKTIGEPTRSSEDKDFYTKSFWYDRPGFETVRIDFDTHSGSVTAIFVY